MNTIDHWREKIDEVDRKLVALLNKRAGYVDEIGRIKEHMGLEAYSPKREEQVLENVLKENKGPLAPDALRRLFERIIDESRKLEREAMLERSKKSTR
jgi:chorismate mutase